MDAGPIVGTQMLVYPKATVISDLYQWHYRRADNRTFVFAEDTSMFCPIFNGDIKLVVQSLNLDLEAWGKEWLIMINPF